MALFYELQAERFIDIGYTSIILDIGPRLLGIRRVDLRS
ncbi:hypothetical protein SBF1_2640021 [Candidatus Desulfosporosinus infrequens]|uniref:Uncharacterized protein n=1 Tax=Candidatus Desulfosporosinus infrequens TaxID=2043169 RepID=A0A2U3KSN0_9FIRM|nr:hypothetical protein SBF1_2640021 [Candidatus Desulfosporosinus infrequens]